MNSCISGTRILEVIISGLRIFSKALKIKVKIKEVWSLDVSFLINFYWCISMNKVLTKFWAFQTCNLVICLICITLFILTRVNYFRVMIPKTKKIFDFILLHKNSKEARLISFLSHMDIKGYFFQWNCIKILIIINSFFVFIFVIDWKKNVLLILNQIYWNV